MHHASDPSWHKAADETQGGRMKKIETEKEREEIIHQLDVSIAQWTQVVALNLSVKQKKTTWFNTPDGKTWDPTDWSGNCYLCRHANGACLNCPMYGLWSIDGTRHTPEDDYQMSKCSDEFSSYQQFRRAGVDERGNRAAVVLADMLRARQYYENIDIQPKTYRFRLKPVKELLKLEGVKPVFCGLSLTKIHGDLWTVFISEEMLENMSAVYELSEDDYQLYLNGDYINAVKKPWEGASFGRLRLHPSWLVELPQ